MSAGDFFDIKGKLVLDTQFDGLSTEEVNQEVDGQGLSNLSIDTIDVPDKAVEDIRKKVQAALVARPLEISNDNVQLNVEKWKITNLSSLQGQIQDALKANIYEINVAVSDESFKEKLVTPNVERQIPTAPPSPAQQQSRIILPEQAQDVGGIPIIGEGGGQSADIASLRSAILDLSSIVQNLGAGLVAGGGAVGAPSDASIFQQRQAGLANIEQDVSQAGEISKLFERLIEIVKAPLAKDIPEDQQTARDTEVDRIIKVLSGFGVSVDFLNARVEEIKAGGKRAEQTSLLAKETEVGGLQTKQKQIEEQIRESVIEEMVAERESVKGINKTLREQTLLLEGFNEDLENAKTALKEGTAKRKEEARRLAETQVGAGKELRQVAGGGSTKKLEAARDRLAESLASGGLSEERANNTKQLLGKINKVLADREAVEKAQFENSKRAAQAQKDAVTQAQAIADVQQRNVNDLETQRRQTTTAARSALIEEIEEKDPETGEVGKRGRDFQRRVTKEAEKADSEYVRNQEKINRLNSEIRDIQNNGLSIVRSLKDALSATNKEYRRLFEIQKIAVGAAFGGGEGGGGGGGGDVEGESLVGREQRLDLSGISPEAQTKNAQSALRKALSAAGSTTVSKEALQASDLEEENQQGILRVREKILAIGRSQLRQQGVKNATDEQALATGSKIAGVQDAIKTAQSDIAAGVFDATGGYDSLLAKLTAANKVLTDANRKEKERLIIAEQIQRYVSGQIDASGFQAALKDANIPADQLLKTLIEIEKKGRATIAETADLTGNTDPTRAQAFEAAGFASGVPVETREIKELTPQLNAEAEKGVTIQQEKNAATREEFETKKAQKDLESSINALLSGATQEELKKSKLDKESLSTATQVVDAVKRRFATEVRARREAAGLSKEQVAEEITGAELLDLLGKTRLKEAIRLQQVSKDTTSESQASAETELGTLVRTVQQEEKKTAEDKKQAKLKEDIEKIPAIISKVAQGKLNLQDAEKAVKNLSVDEKTREKTLQGIKRLYKEISEEARDIEARKDALSSAPIGTPKDQISGTKARKGFAQSGGVTALAPELAVLGDARTPEEIDSALNSISTKVKEVSDQIREDLGAKAAAKLKRESIFTRLALQAKRFGVYTLIASASFKLRAATRELITTTINFERQMIEVTKVMNVTERQMGDLRNTARDFGQEFGFSITEAADAMKVYAQQGKNVVEVTEATRASMLLANVSALDLKQSTEALTAVLNQFNIDANEATRVVDAWNEVANNHAVTEVDLAEAVKRSGSAAKEAGVSFESFAGYVTALQARTRRGGKVIGTTLKTLFSRLNTDKAIKELDKVGIATFELDGEFVKAEKRIDNLSKIWQTLTSVQRNNIAFAVAGRRQYAQFLALMQGYGEAVDAVSDAQNSQGSALEEQGKIIDTVEKRLLKLRATWESVATSLAEGAPTDIFKGLLSGIEGITSLVGELSSSFSAVAGGGVLAGLSFRAARAGAGEYAAFRGAKDDELERIKSAKATDLLSKGYNTARTSILSFVKALDTATTETFKYSTTVTRSLPDAYGNQTYIKSAREREITTTPTRFQRGATAVGNFATSGIGAGIIGGAVATAANQFSDYLVKRLEKQLGRPATELEIRGDVGVQAAGAAEFGGSALALSGISGATQAISDELDISKGLVTGLVPIVAAVGYGLFKWAEYSYDFTKGIQQAKDELERIKEEADVIEGSLSKLTELEKSDFGRENIQKQLDVFNQLRAKYPELISLQKEFTDLVFSGESGSSVIEKALDRVRDRQLEAQSQVGREEIQYLTSRGSSDRVGGIAGAIGDIGALATAAISIPNIVANIFQGKGFSESLSESTDLVSDAIEYWTRSESEDAVASLNAVFEGEVLSGSEKKKYRDTIAAAGQAQAQAYAKDLRDLLPRDVENLTGGDIEKALKELNEVQAKAASDFEEALKETEENPIAQQLVQEGRNATFQNIEAKRQEIQAYRDLSFATENMLKTMSATDAAFDILSISTQEYIKNSQEIVGLYNTLEQSTGISFATERVAEFNKRLAELDNVLGKTSNLRGFISTLRPLAEAQDFQSALSIGGQPTGLVRQIGGDFEASGQDLSSGSAKAFAIAIRGLYTGSGGVISQFKRFTEEARKGDRTARKEINSLLTQVASETGFEGGLTQETFAGLLGLANNLLGISTETEDYQKALKGVIKDTEEYAKLQQEELKTLQSVFGEFDKVAKTGISSLEKLFKLQLDVVRAEEASLATRKEISGLPERSGDQSKLQTSIIRFRKAEADRLRFSAVAQKQLASTTSRLGKINLDYINAITSGADPSKLAEVERLRGEVVGKTLNQQITIYQEANKKISSSLSDLNSVFSEFSAELSQRESGRRGLFLADPKQVFQEQLAADSLLRLVGDGPIDDEARSRAFSLSRSSRESALAGLDRMIATGTEEQRERAKQIKQELFLTDEETRQRQQIIDRQGKLLDKRLKGENEIVKLRKQLLKIEKKNSDQILKDWQTTIAGLSGSARTLQGRTAERADELTEENQILRDIEKSISGQAAVLKKGIEDGFREARKQQAEAERQKESKEVSRGISSSFNTGGSRQQNANELLSLVFGGNLDQFIVNQRPELRNLTASEREPIGATIKDAFGTVSELIRNQAGNNVTLNLNMEKAAKNLVEKVFKVIEDGVVTKEEAAEITDIILNAQRNNNELN